MTHPLISAGELGAWLAGDAGPRLLDCRFDLARPQAGREQWLQGHLPGALHADLDRDLSDLPVPAAPVGAAGRHPLPQAAAFAAALARWGVTEQTPVVVYDHGPGALAARLWWLLRSCGHERVQLLDGGLRAWLAAGGEIENGAVEVASAPLRSVQAFAGWIDNTKLAEGLASGRWCLLDAREAARHRGEIEPIDPVAGHIPGALSRPFAENLDAHGGFRPAAQLRADFEALLGDCARTPERVVHQCGSGVTACHNLLAMELAGLHGSLLHAPSWSGWIAEGREVATG